MSDTPMLEGGCLCGAIRYRASAAPFDADHCHCDQCRRSTGAVVASWMDFKREQVQWLQGEPKEFASSDKIRRGFCPNCGSSISYRHLDYPDYFTLSIASLDEPGRVSPNYHIYTDSAVPWLVIEDDLPRYPRGRS